MNAYTTMGQARIKPPDFSAVLRANELAGPCLAGLERQRGGQAAAAGGWLAQCARARADGGGPCRAGLARRRGGQAAAEVDWLLKHTRVRPQETGSRVALLRQTIGAA